MGKMKKIDDASQDANHTYWISISDLMSNLVFIFLIILTVFAVQYKQEQSSLISAKTELQSPALTRQQILTDLKTRLQKEGLDVEILVEEGILRLTESTLSFQAAKAVPDAGKLAHLGILARALTSVIPCYSTALKTSPADDRPAWCQPLATTIPYECRSEHTGSIETIMIEGHTDATLVRAGAGYRDNLALSAARATTVLRLLITCDEQLGALYNKKQQPLVGASGYSDLRPIIKDSPKDPRNRRIDIRLVMDLPENALEAAQSPSQAHNRQHLQGKKGL